MSNLLYNLELEQHILGCILVDPNYAIPVSIASMSAHDFYDDRHKDIYEVMVELYKKNLAVETLMMFQVRPTLDKFYVSGLADSMPTARVIRDYITQLVLLSQRRSVMREIGTLKQALLDGGNAEAEVEKFLNSVSTIKKNTSKGVVRIKEVLPEVYEQIKKGKEWGFKTGFECIDKFNKGFHRQNLIILATGTGKGKSAFVSNVIVNSLPYDKSILFVSVEMSVTEIVARMIATASGVSNRMTDDVLDSMPMANDSERQRITRNRLQGIGNLSDSHIYIDDRPQDMLSINSVARNLKFELERKGRTLDLIVVDYLQLIRANAKLSREQQVGSVADELKWLAKTMDVPVVALAQTNREADRDKRDYGVGDLRESARIEQNADVIIFLNRSEENETDYSLKIAKNRHGSCTKQKLIFEPELLKFTEVLEDLK